ncbi:uncharacterized protein LOC132554659 [Ylistrum balloti]|uniref:uncharacterized protein LOC132554659 n=1 Tax=Ylistrum balloti TaxID=509963 RepID=UPI00290594AF|nr:uncharacterized protein LOC132554659 [Ylistrum balloti]
MDTDDYEAKVMTMLHDNKTYEQLQTNPTNKLKRRLISILTRLKQESKITESQYRYLYPTAENTPRIYCTPKIHKQGNPLRPIVDYTGSIGYNVSRSLADILGPLVGKSEHHVRNSKHLAEAMSTIMIQEDEQFISHDVVSLFTNTPIDDALKIIQKRLESDRSWRKNTNLQIKDIMDLLEFVLTRTYFTFRGNIYQQRFGTAMGSPVSPIVANLFMEHLEQQAIATAPIDCKPSLWKRYVDDILEIIKKGSQKDLTNHINTIDTTNNIKFTCEEETNCGMPFLDTLIARREDGTVKLLVYRKKTHTDQYLNFESHHPLHQKLGVVRTLLNRCETIVTEQQDKIQEQSHIMKAMKNCEYPEWALKRVQKQCQNKGKNRKRPMKDQNKTKIQVIIPYIKGISETIQRIYRNHGIATAMKPHKTLRNTLVHPKDKITKENVAECIYKIGCKNCDASYIGETGRRFGVRLGEHRKDKRKRSSPDQRGSSRSPR